MLLLFKKSTAIFTKIKGLTVKFIHFPMFNLLILKEELQNYLVETGQIIRGDRPILINIHFEFLQPLK